MTAIPSALPLDSADKRASSHADFLRQWLTASQERDTTQTAYFAALQGALAALVGGGDGIIRSGGAFAVTELDTPGLGIKVAGAGAYAFIGGLLAWEPGGDIEITGLTAPSGDPRIDLVQLAVADGGVTVKTGSEAGSPTAPSPDADNIGLWEIALTVGMTELEDEDFTDIREYV